jgi:hypothetical protein
MTTYVKPSDVQSPKRHWSLIHVIFDGGENGSSLAIGRWDNKPALAMRWNGNSGSPLGNPQSRGLPTWFVVPEQHWNQILEEEPFKSVHSDVMTLARNFLGSKRVYFLSRCPNPACRYFRGLVLHSFLPSDIERTLAELERDEFKLYHIICDWFWKPSREEKADLTSVLKAAWDKYSRDGE